ncbi:MAG TPA: hypothetical protein VHZ81_08565 [Galbitalea sp.]|nr:hypothetical protein [Galbitalea sp.]
MSSPSVDKRENAPRNRLNAQAIAKQLWIAQRQRHRVFIWERHTENGQRRHREDRR